MLNQKLLKLFGLRSGETRLACLRSAAGSGVPIMGQPAVACPTTKEKAGGTNSPSPNWKPYLGSRHGFNQFRRAEMISLHIPNMPWGSGLGTFNVPDK